MPLYRAPAIDVNTISWLALAIKEFPGPQRHVGVYYKSSADEEVRFCHLAWHLKLRDEPTNPEYAWVESNLNETIKKSLVGYFLKIVEAKGNSPPVPYSFKEFNGSSFDPETGRYTKSAPGEGLTCATFVLEVFEQMGIPLVEASTWPTRPEDAAWQAMIISTLTQQGIATAEHIEALRKSVGAIRFRPEEVAAAYRYKATEWPVPATNAIPEGDRLLTQLRS